MKRFISFMLVMVMVCSMTTAFAIKVVDIQFEEMEAHVVGAGKDGLVVKAYKKFVTFDNGCVTDDILLPLREVCEYYGMTVIWHQEDQSVTVTRADFQKPYTFHIGQGSYVIDGKTYTNYGDLPCNGGYMSDNYCFFQNEERLPAYIYV